MNMIDRLRDIDSSKYLNNSLALTRKEKNLIREFKDWLPHNIVDCHTHCGLTEHIREVDEAMYHQMISTFQGFSLKDSRRVGAIFFPEKNLRRLRFPFPFRGIDVKAANNYLLETVSDPDKLALVGIPTDIEYTSNMLKTGKFAALKMYHQQFHPPAEKIHEYFPNKVLEVAESENVPIILHLPKMITSCKDELIEIANNFTRLKISLAHLGLPHLVVPNLQETYDEVASYDNIYMDTSMVPSQEVLTMALKSFSSKKIMFGTDEPINLVRSVVYQNPDLGQRLVTEYMYHWVDEKEHEEYEHLAQGATHMHWPAIQAVRDAIETLYPSEKHKQVKSDIFSKNAEKFFNFN
jgi:predicted TIM-barrel fold metal-dependent hydrolase